MTENEFKNGIAYLSKVYGKISDDMYTIYWDILKKYTDEQFKKMIGSIISTFRPTSQVPFPLPPDFLEAIGATGKNRAIAALNAVKDTVEKVGAWCSVDFGDGALHAVINDFGGWPEICTWGNLDEWKYKDRAFMEAYEAALACGNNEGPVAGIFELESNKKDQSVWTPIQMALAAKSKTSLKINWHHDLQVENKDKPHELPY